MEKEMKHTPGPWRVGPASTIEGNRLGQRGIWTADKHIGIADVYGHSEHNARLIAAAPELLEALQSLITPDANAHVQRTKEELFRLAPEIKALADRAISKATA